MPLISNRSFKCSDEVIRFADCSLSGEEALFDSALDNLSAVRSVTWHFADGAIVADAFRFASAGSCNASKIIISKKRTARRYKKMRGG